MRPPPGDRGAAPGAAGRRGRSADYPRDGRGGDRALRRAVGAREAAVRLRPRRAARSRSSPSRAGPRCATCGGTIGWIANKALADKRDARRARAGVADVRGESRRHRAVVFRAEQNVLLELAEPAASASDHGRARLGEGAATATGRPASCASRRCSASSTPRRDPCHPAATTCRSTSALLGAGAWGTALAVTSARRRMRVTLWARDAAHAALLAHRAAERALSAGRRPAGGADGHRRPRRGAHAQQLLIVAPRRSSALPATRAIALAAAGARAPLVVAVEGLRRRPLLPAGVGLAHQVLAPRWPAPVGRRLGPELRRGSRTRLADRRSSSRRPIARSRAQVARAAARRHAARLRQRRHRRRRGRAARSRTCSRSRPARATGLRFGHNARAALITRGLAETGAAVRARWAATRDTLMGLAGLGDLVAHLHRRSVAQPARRARAGARRARCRRSSRRSATSPEGVARRAARARSPRITASTCRSSTPCIACCTKNCRRGDAVARAACARADGRKQRRSCATECDRTHGSRIGRRSSHVMRPRIMALAR